MQDEDAMVDEASLESMVCSDPPAHGGVTAGAPAPAAFAPPVRERRDRALRAGALFVGGMALLAWGAMRGRSRKRRAPPPSLLKDALVGVAATQALDWLSIALYESESPEARAVEDEARGHRHAYEVALVRTTQAVDVSLSEEQIRTWAWRVHKVFGVAGGIGYAALRRRVPLASAGAGSLFGSAFFLIVDEVLVPVSGLTPGPRAFPWQTHARGAASHLAYGVAAELAARALA